MKNYKELFEQARNSRDAETMQSIFDEVFDLVPVETDGDRGAKIAESRNKAGQQGKKI